jgi:hypothetical protein
VCVCVCVIVRLVCSFLVNHSALALAFLTPHQACLHLTLRGDVSPYVLLNDTSLRGPALYLTRFRKVFRKCWLALSLSTRRLVLFRGSDEQHTIRSITWPEVCQAVPSAYEPVLHVVMVDRTHHIRVADMATQQAWIVAINALFE